MEWDYMVKQKFIENTLSDAVYCDVGACKGDYTSFFKALSGESGKVYSFEINPKNYSQIIDLKSNNCIIENLAVSDINNQQINVYGNNVDDYQSNILGYDIGYQTQEILSTVNSVTLDDYFKDIKVDFIKIDVEGAELKVIKGGLNTIKNCKLCVIECHFDEDWKEIHDLLTSNGLVFKNLVDNEEVFCSETTKKEGRSENGRPYQMYLINY